jgi:hypothetical protein
MCQDRRAWFQKVDLKGREPEVAYSFNPTAWQWWLWLGGRLVAIVVGLWVGISFVAGHVFDERLNQFHDVAVPEIESLIENKLEVRRLQSYTDRQPTVERIHALEAEDQRVGAILTEYGKQLDRIEDKVDILIRNGRDHAGRP